ncbi:hypothetical protein QBC45DRAFT_426828 [Copromyces sp. CBS 386.78]|nr:hypothetical protein QBC45DRAFT_426828 [Copromyces sp. CBS 386.78]
MSDSVTHTSPSSNSSPSFHSLFGTSPPSHPDRDPIDHDDDEPSPTQPFSLPGEVSGLNGGDNLRDELTDSVVTRDDDNLSTVFDSSDDERYCKLDLVGRGGVVLWEDAEHDIRHTSKLSMDFHVDTSEQQALFILHAPVFLKATSDCFFTFRLLMYPENIRSIEFHPSTRPSTPGMEDAPNTFMRLRFLMTQPPSLVVPRDRPLDPKPRSQDLFDAMKSLATVLELNVYLNNLCFVPEARLQLASLPAVFPSTNIGDRPKTDAYRANLQRMNRGLGAEILDMGATVAVPDAVSPNTAAKQVEHETIEEVAPVYSKDGALQSPAQVITPSDRKRRRTSESQSPSPAGKRILTAFAQLTKSHAALQSRVEHLEKVLADPAGCDHTPCRYDSEELGHIIGHVDDKIDNDMLDVRIELEDQVFGETKQLVLEKTEEQHSQLWEDMRGGLDDMRREIKEELMAELRQELVAVVKMDLFKDMAQAMMRAACGGDGGKSGTGMSQSTQSTDSTQ